MRPITISRMKCGRLVRAGHPTCCDAGSQGVSHRLIYWQFLGGLRVWCFAVVQVGLALSLI
jgi:hypothetical protein